MRKRRQSRATWRAKTTLGLGCIALQYPATALQCILRPGPIIAAAKVMVATSSPTPVQAGRGGPGF